MSETCLVTGCAGFIGSHVAERLLREGHTVVGVDCFTDAYPRQQKEANLRQLQGKGSLEFIEGDLTKLDLTSLMDGVTCVVHLAAHGGLRFSWGRDFAFHDRNNILATQLLLEASMRVDRFIYASSASIYGEVGEAPVNEQAVPHPIVPYAASKLAGEALCNSYAVCCRVPVVTLRLFTVYGARQRPDMAIHRWMRNLLEGVDLEVYGDGHQTRDFIHVSDVVDAFMAALRLGGRGDVYNIGSGTATSMRSVIDKLKSKQPATVQTNYREPYRGEVRGTVADISKAQEKLGFAPKVALDEGLEDELNWLRDMVVTTS
jgi:nucleoside-diphosphate-sugar epimerase